jgi:hypothetical protein
VVEGEGTAEGVKSETWNVKRDKGKSGHVSRFTFQVPRFHFCACIVDFPVAHLARGKLVDTFCRAPPASGDQGQDGMGAGSKILFVKNFTGVLSGGDGGT